MSQNVFTLHTSPDLKLTRYQEGEALNDTQVLIKTVADVAALPLGVITKLYNQHAAKPVTRFADRKEAARRTWTLLTAVQEASTSDEETSDVSTKSKKSGKKANGKAKRPAGRPKSSTPKDYHNGKLDNAQYIVVLSDVNPRRTGTNGHANWKLYKGGGITIAEYKKAGGGMNHLRWDLGHEFIRLQASAPRS